MPHAAPKPCVRHPWELVTKHNSCKECQSAPPPPKPNIDTRPNANARGYGSRWRKARMSYLKRHPLCVYCMADGQRVTVATVVDHEPPHKGDMVMFWDKTTWQSLCKRCHDIKTATHDGGFGHATQRGET